MERAQEAANAENMMKGMAMASDMKEKHMPKQRETKEEAEEKFSD